MQYDKDVAAIVELMQTLTIKKSSNILFFVNLRCVSWRIIICYYQISIRTLKISQ